MEQMGAAAEWTGTFSKISFQSDESNLNRIATITDIDKDDGRRRIVGTPNMNCLCKALVMNRENDGITTQFGSRVRKIIFDYEQRKWMLHIAGDRVPGSSETSDRIEGPFDGIVAADKLLASDSVKRLFKDEWPLYYVGRDSDGNMLDNRTDNGGITNIIKGMRTITSTPSFVLMLELKRPLSTEGSSQSNIFDGAIVENSETVAWIANNSSKPGRDNSSESVQRWVLQSTAEFATKKLDDSGEALRKLKRGSEEYNLAFKKIGDEMFDVFGKVMLGLYNIQDIEVKSMTVHRWGSAFPLCGNGEENNDMILSDHTMKIVSCGDWTRSPNVEGAILSGLDAGDKLSEMLLKDDH